MKNHNDRVQFGLRDLMICTLLAACCSVLWAYKVRWCAGRCDALELCWDAFRDFSVAILVYVAWRERSPITIIIPLTALAYYEAWDFAIKASSFSQGVAFWHARLYPVSLMVYGAAFGNLIWYGIAWMSRVGQAVPKHSRIAGTVASMCPAIDFVTYIVVLAKG